MDPVSQIKLTPLNFYCDLMNVDSFLEEFVPHVKLSVTRAWASNYYSASSTRFLLMKFASWKSCLKSRLG